MAGFKRLLRRLQNTLRPHRADPDLERELSTHLVLLEDEFQRRGLSPDEARLAAKRAFGGLLQTKEGHREARALAWFDDGLGDIRYAIRILRRSPGFAIAAIAIVALGTGAVTAVFSVLYGVVLRPLSFPEPDRLVNIWTVNVQRFGSLRVQANAADHREWQLANHVFEDIALVRPVVNFNLTGVGEPERLLGALLSANFFSVVGVTPEMGRPFTTDDEQPGHENVVLLSDGLWKRQFGSDPAIVGRTINLGSPHVVVGVMGPDFNYPARDVQIWKPLVISRAEITRQEPGNNYVAIARLKRTVTIGAAQAEMTTIASNLEQQHPPTNVGSSVEVAPALDETVKAVRPALYAMFAAVAALLVIACLNLANLLSARAASRSGEFAVRLSLGASRMHLVMQAIAEVIPLLLMGGTTGLLLAWWAVSALVPMAVSLPRLENVGMNGRVLTCSIAALTVTGVVAGLLPAAQAWRSSLYLPMRVHRTIAGSASHTRGRRVLVALQLAVVLPLLISAGLLARSFLTLSAVEPGFQHTDRLTLQVAIPRSTYPRDSDVNVFCARVIDAVASVPGVRSLGMVNRLPLGGVGQVGILDIEHANLSVTQMPSVDWRSVTPGYFDAMGIPLLKGRPFNEHDDALVETVGIVDERLARHFWPGESSIGKRFRIPVPGQPWVRIVGVVGHVHHDGLDSDPRPQVYWNYKQRAQDRMALVVRTAGDPRLLAQAVLQAIHRVDQNQAVYDVRTMGDVLNRTLMPQWLNTTLVVIFALIALLLSAAGVYGVVAYGVTQQFKEFSIRLAMGATRVQIVALVFRRVAVVAAVGVGIGLILAVALTGALRHVLYGIQPGDLLTFATSTVVLVTAVISATVIPAWRASRAEPLVALRYE